MPTIVIASFQENNSLGYQYIDSDAFNRSTVSRAQTFNGTKKYTEGFKNFDYLIENDSQAYGENL